MTNAELAYSRLSSLAAQAQGSDAAQALDTALSLAYMALHNPRSAARYAHKMRRGLAHALLLSAGSKGADKGTAQVAEGYRACIELEAALLD